MVVRHVELGRIMGESGASVPVFGAMEVLDARKYVLGHSTETRPGSVMLICSGYAWRHRFRVAFWSLCTRVGDVIQNIFVSRYFLGRVRCGWP